MVKMNKAVKQKLRKKIDEQKQNFNKELENTKEPINECRKIQLKRKIY